jgi:hypothetical protein
MTIPTIPMNDATAASIGHLPAGEQAAGYTTGTGGIAWTAAEFAAHGHPYPAVRIVQDAGATDRTADVADYETGTMPLPVLMAWAADAFRNYHAHVQRGQRSPAIYMSRSKVTEVANGLVAAKLTGVGLAIADWNADPYQATAEVANAGGPFPVVWRQYADKGGFDAGIVSVPWLTRVSGPALPPHVPVPPGQWLDPASWTWKAVTVAGTGLNGKPYKFTLTGNQWIPG